MTLTIDNTTRANIIIASTILDDFITAPASYTNIKIQIYQNSITDSVTETYTDSDPIDATTNVATVAGTEYINPAFFGATEFVQGVYHVIVTLTDDSSIQTDEGCIYVENGLKCLVDDYLINEKPTVQERILQGLKYQSLISATECPCKCDKKTELYLDLIDSLTNKCTTC